MKGMEELDPLLDFYVPTVGTNWVEVRAICRRGCRLAIAFNDGPMTALEPVGVNHEWDFFRRQELGLRPATKGKFELSVDGRSHFLSFETLPIPSGQFKLRIGILTDLHLTGRSHRSDSVIRPSKRLYSVAEELARKYLQILEKQGADLIVLPGDTLDPCTPETIDLAKDMFSSVAIPCVPILGNHEVSGMYSEEQFHRAFGLPPEGYHSRDENGVRLMLLSTPDQISLAPTRAQYGWLEAQLEKSDRDTFLFAHFSLLLHPCVQGPRNDGMQQLCDYEAILRLLRRYPQVRVFLGGHKNVPSKVLHEGILHLLCPQLIQAPCSYAVIEVYDGGIVYNVYEIEEQHYLQASREAFGIRYAERFGRPEDRNYYFEWV